MKKRKIYALLSLVLALLMLFGCGKADAPQNGESDTNTSSPDTTEEDTTLQEETTTEAVTTEDVLPDDVTLTMKQVSTIEKEDYKSVSDYSDFLSVSKKTFVVPGLPDNTIPQGLAYSPSDGRLYVSSYSGKSNTASVVLAMNAKGEFVAEYFLLNLDGTPFTGHVGGIAVTEKYMYISIGGNGNGAYCLAEFKLSDLPRYGSHSVKIRKKVNIPSGTSYLSYYDGVLWAGNFYLKGTYDLGSKFNFVTPVDGKEYGGYVAAYVLDNKNSRLLEDRDLEYAKPDYVLATPDKVQGFAYIDGKVILSISYGRKNNSQIAVYSASILSSRKKITIDGVEYPFDVLSKSNHIKTYTALPMSEGITLTNDGELLVLFESAAMKYSDSKCPTDYIWKTDF